MVPFVSSITPPHASAKIHFMKSFENITCAWLGAAGIGNIIIVSVVFHAILKSINWCYAYYYSYAYCYAFTEYNVIYSFDVVYFHILFSLCYIAMYFFSFSIICHTLLNGVWWHSKYSLYCHIHYFHGLYHQTHSIYSGAYCYLLCDVHWCIILKTHFGIFFTMDFAIYYLSSFHS